MPHDAEIRRDRVGRVELEDVLEEGKGADEEAALLCYRCLKREGRAHRPTASHAEAKGRAWAEDEQKKDLKILDMRKERKGKVVKVPAGRVIVSS